MPNALDAAATPSPATRLLGLTLPDGWIVKQRIDRPNCATGGCFSIQYVVELPDGTRGFLKALDFSDALASNNPAQALQPSVNAFNFESKLCEECKHKRLSKVVHPITSNKINADPSSPFGVVQYIIFELGRGDIRKILDELTNFDLALVLRAAHNVAVGIRQLHGIGVAHQDVKPSNILGFEPRSWKVADLGSASRRDEPGPTDSFDVAGDKTYAPPERLYGFSDPSWNSRRIACDLYLLGNLVVFLFARISLTAAAFQHLDPSHRPQSWGGAYDDVLLYLREAYECAFEEMLADVPEVVRNEIASFLRRLCDPDPRIRADDSISLLQRFISAFDRMARGAEYRLLRHIPA